MIPPPLRGGKGRGEKGSAVAGGASLKNASIFSKRCRPLHRTAQHFLLRRTFAA